MKISAKFDHFNFNVSNLNNSIKFYNETLGLVEKKRIESKDGSFTIVYLSDEKSEFLLELTELTDHPQKYDLGECEFHLCVRVPNYKEIWQQHEKMGVICYVNESMGLYFIEDPDGYWIEVLPEK